MKNKMKQTAKMALMLSVLVFAVCHANAAGIENLKPLPKVHYSWPVRTDLEPEQLYQLARIMGSLTVSGRWATEDHVIRCVEICKRVNKTNPKIESSLAIQFSPLTRLYPKNVSPTNRGDLYYDDLVQTRTRAKLIKGWIGSKIKVTAVLLDCERFYVRADDKKWNEGIRQALDTVHSMMVYLFPEASIEWYGRGVLAGATQGGWKKTPYFTGQEIKAPLSCSLYSVPEIERTRETYRRTVALADELGIDEVTPWVALASGYRRGIKGLSDATFDFDWDYDLVYSYLLGANLNKDWYGLRPERYAPYTRAKIIIFYPPPFDKRVPHWEKHFISYVRGATGIKKIKDLE